MFPNCQCKRNWVMPHEKQAACVELHQDFWPKRRDERSASRKHIRFPPFHVDLHQAWTRVHELVHGHCRHFNLAGLSHNAPGSIDIDSHGSRFVADGCVNDFDVVEPVNLDVSAQAFDVLRDRFHRNDAQVGALSRETAGEHSDICPDVEDDRSAGQIHGGCVQSANVRIPFLIPLKVNRNRSVNVEVAASCNDGSLIAHDTLQIPDVFRPYFSASRPRW